MRVLRWLLLRRGLLMAPDELRPILQGYRKQVEQGWSKATAHPSYEGADGSPVGQCGVTSAWLQRRLREDHGVETNYCVGDVLSVRGIESVDHCWLETTARVVIDITASQMEWLTNLPVVCFPHAALKHQWIDYQAATRVPAPHAGDPVRDRLALLESALS